MKKSELFIEHEFETIYGEIEESITPFVSMVEAEDEDRHAVVGLDIDGYKVDEDGKITLLVSPHNAVALAEEIQKVSSEANFINYHLLRKKPPF